MGMDNTISNQVVTAAYDCATGYYYMHSDTDGVVQKTWNYASGNKVITAIEKSGQKLYTETTYESEAAALESAAAAAEQSKANNGELAKGESCLQTLKGFIDQHKVNSDEDPSNDEKNDYEVYDLTFEATGEAGAFDAKCTLVGSGEIDLGDGLIQQSSLSGMLDISYRNGYLTKYVEEATMLEVLPIDETTQMSMKLVVNQELVLSYDFSPILPNLAEFTFVAQ